jgi:hypothetical protein
MADVEQTSAEAEQRFHHYTGNAIPWYVRLIWIVFWAFVIYYSIRYFLPTIQVEMQAPP